MKATRRLRIEATAYPGLIDLIRGEDGAGSAEVGVGLMDYLETPYVAGSAIDSEIRRAVLEGSGVEPVLLSAEHVSWLKSFLHPSQETIVGQQTSPIPVQAFLISLPSVVGARAILTASKDIATDVSATIKVFGIGGGPEWKVDIKQQLTRDTGEGEVVVLSLPATFEIVDSETTPPTRYARLVRIESGECDFDFKPLPAISWDPGWQAVKTYKSDQSHVTGGVVKLKLDISTGTTWELSPDIKLDQFGLEFGAKATVTYSTDVSIECALPDGYAYIANLAPAPPVFVWDASPGG